MAQQQRSPQAPGTMDHEVKCYSHLIPTRRDRLTFERKDYEPKDERREDRAEEDRHDPAGEELLWEPLLEEAIN